MLHVPEGMMFNETKMLYIMHNDDGTDGDDHDTNNERKQIFCVIISILDFFCCIQIHLMLGGISTLQTLEYEY